MVTPAGTPPRQGLAPSAPKPSDLRSGRPSCHPWARSASPPPTPSLPQSSCFCSRAPATPKECLLPGERAHRFRKLLLAPGLVTSDRGPRRLSSNSRRPGRVGTPASVPKSSRRAPPPTASPATASRPPLTLRHPSQRSQSPRLPHPSWPAQGKLQPTTRSPWPSPRGLACERPRPSQKA